MSSAAPKRAPGRAWLRNSLRHREGELRKRAAMARRAYKAGGMRDMAVLLADAYDEAADVFARVLAAEEGR